jgi:acyl-CoA synthetase (AMP-forming)/AMP-acid ligase II
MRLVGPTLQPPRVATINQALREAARSASGLHLIDAHGSETHLPFARLHDNARRVAGSLAGLGVGPGQRVAVSLPTGHDFLVSFFGVLLAGAVPVPIAPPTTLCKTGERLRTIGTVLHAVSACLLVTSPALLPQLGQAAGRAPSCRRCVTAGELLSGSVRVELDADPDALGLIQLSSGSTSDPKPVALSHANLVSQLAALEQLTGRGGVGVSWLPMYHDMGLIGCLLSAVYQAGPLALMAPETFLTRPVTWLRAISRHRATISPAPNFAFRQCLTRVRDADLEGLDLSSWRHALNGAEAVSASLVEQFGARFAAVGFDPGAMHPAYGLAESSLAVTTTVGHRVRALRVDATALAEQGRVGPPHGKAREIVSVGRAVPGSQVEVRGPDGRALGEGRVGCIFTRGPSVMRGYFDNPAATADALQDGWLNTGDLGFISEQELFVSGRAKDVIIIRGANHSPHEFEDCLAELAGLRTGLAAVAAGFIPSGSNDEELLLLVERGVDPPPDLPRRIASVILDRTGIKPHTVAMLERGALPRTTSGKLRRAEALKRYLSGDLRPAVERPQALSLSSG